MHINTHKHIDLKFDLSWILFLCHSFVVFNDITPVFVWVTLSKCVLIVPNSVRIQLKYELFVRSYAFYNVIKVLSQIVQKQEGCKEIKMFGFYHDI